MWNFSAVSRQETRGKSKLPDFFVNAGDAESLVRESLQNALDAKSENQRENPVSVKITVGRQKKLNNDWLFSEFDQHVAAVRSQTNPTFPIEVPEDFGYVLIEDFNTLGFGGTFDNEDEMNKGSLVSFWWEEGEGNKPKGGGGSHGVGKVTLSEASQSGLFFATSVREEDMDEILLGYCRIGMHRYDNKIHREYGRFGVAVAGDTDESMLWPYSSKNGTTIEVDKIQRFKEAFGIDRTEPGSSILIPNIDTDHVNKGTIIEAVLDNFYLPIIKGLLTIEIFDKETDQTLVLDSESFFEYCAKTRGDNNEYLIKLELATFLIEDSGFYSSSTEFEFSSESKRVCEEVFSKEQLENMRLEYHEGKGVKARLNVKLYPADGPLENGFMCIAVQRRKNRADDPQFYNVFRGDINIQDETLGTAKANGILDIFGAHDEDAPNALSEFMKYCEDPGHKHWKGAINRRNEPLHYQRSETWQKSLVRTAVRDLIHVLENDEETKFDDFADDIFFFEVQGEIDGPGQQLDDEGIEDKDLEEEEVMPPPPPPPPPDKSYPLVSISAIAGGVRIAGTKHLRDALKEGLKIPALETIFCYEMFGASKAAWTRYGSMDIDLNDTGTYSITCKDAEYKYLANHSLAITPVAGDFTISITGFDTNRQLYTNVKDRAFLKAAGGAE